MNQVSLIFYVMFFIGLGPVSTGVAAGKCSDLLKIPSISLKEANQMADTLHIRQLPVFKNQSPEARLAQLKDVITETEKVPESVRYVIGQTGRNLIEIVIGNITNHPAMAHLKGIVPRNRAKVGNLQTWDTLPGKGGNLTVIAADSLYKGHRSVNLILHEIAHTYEMALKEFTDSPIFLSQQNDFLAVHRAIKWDQQYFRDNPGEAFAESFARYFDSPASNSRLRQQYPSMYHYLLVLFGPYKDCLRN